jgi:hypothetical protein
LLQACCGLLAFGCGDFSAMQGADPLPSEPWRIWLEASFFRPVAYAPVTAARKTVVAAGKVDEAGELVAFSQEAWSELKVGWVDFWKQATRNAAEDFRKAEVRFERDAKQVIRYAEVVSREGRASALVFAPGFATHFEETMGESFLLAVPSRYQCFVFPKLVGDVSRYAALVTNAYRASAYPVSLELFECEKGGIWAAGFFERP